ncbi:MAG: hypothetical protein D6732_01270 [Methanobacteriota archaeon]|nr:MAG: hypothetical protein D6732_01270 [Euryarchaeota archaeon]
MTDSNGFLDYKAIVENLIMNSMRSPSGSPFSPKELEVVLHGIPNTELDLRKLFDGHSKRRRIELKPQIYPWWFPNLWQLIL